MPCGVCTQTLSFALFCSSSSFCDACHNSAQSWFAFSSTANAPPHALTSALEDWTSAIDCSPVPSASASASTSASASPLAARLRAKHLLSRAAVHERLASASASASAASPSNSKEKGAHPSHLLQALEDRCEARRLGGGGGADTAAAEHKELVRVLHSAVRERNRVVMRLSPLLFRFSTVC